MRQPTAGGSTGATRRAGERTHSAGNVTRAPLRFECAGGHGEAGAGGKLPRRSSVSCISAHDPQLARLADAIAQRVGQQRFSVWFNNSTKLDLKPDELEIAVPNDFISDWIVRHFAKTIQDAALEVLGCSLLVRYSVLPQLFVGNGEDGPVLEKRLVLAAARHNGN